MTTSPDWGTPLVVNQQSQPEVTHNVAILMLQAIAVGGALTITNTPGTLTDGNLYIIGTSPTGAWAGRANKLAYAYGGSWYYLPGVDSDGTPITMGARHEGLRVYVQDQNTTYLWTGSAWMGSTAVSISLGITADQTLSASAYTKIDFDTVIAAGNANFFTVVGDGGVTILQTGVYVITALVYVENGAASPHEHDVGFFAGGSLYYGEIEHNVIDASATRSILRTGVLHVGTVPVTVDVRIWTDGPTSKVESAPTIHGLSPSAGNRLSIVRLG